MEVQGDQENEQRILPIFMKNQDIPEHQDNPPTVLQVCRAAESVCGKGEIEGAQLIRNLWRVYIKTEDGRLALLTQKLPLRGTVVPVYSDNPYIHQNPDSQYLAIHDLPLSYSNEEIQNWLQSRGVKLAGEIRYQRVRDEQGKLTNFKTGSRFVFVSGDMSKIPCVAQIGLFKARLWYKGQEKQKAKLTCTKCLREGHIKKFCTFEVVCLFCKQEGHTRSSCTASIPTEPARSEICDRESMPTPEPTDHTGPQGTPPVASPQITSEEIARLVSLVRKAAGKTPQKNRRKEGCKRSRQKSNSSQEWTRKNKKSREDTREVSEREDSDDTGNDNHPSPPRIQRKTQNIKTWLHHSKES